MIKFLEFLEIEFIKIRVFESRAHLFVGVEFIKSKFFRNKIFIHKNK